MKRRSGRTGNAPSPVPDLSDLVPTTSTGKRGGPSNKKKKEQEVEVTRPSLRAKEKMMKQKELEEIMNTVESEEEDSSDSEENDIM